MHYLYKDFLFGQHNVRLVRLPGFPPNTIAHLLGNAFHGEGELPTASSSLTTHDLYQLLQLREQQATEKRLVYFDIADVQLTNSGQTLEDFEAWIYTDDATDWELASGYLK